MRQLKTLCVAIMLAMTLAQSKAQAVYFYQLPPWTCTLENWRLLEEVLGYWQALIVWYGHGCWDVG